MLQPNAPGVEKNLKTLKPFPGACSNISAKIANFSKRIKR